MGDYLLMNLASGNVVGVYDTEEGAIQAVAEGLQRYGHNDPTARNLQLQQQRAGQADQPLLSGEALVRRALAGVARVSDTPRRRSA